VIEDPDVHDLSRLDAFLASRRRATVLHALWRPVLAGAVASLAVSAAIAVVLPRFATREVVVDHVVTHDVAVDVPRITLRDVPVDHVIQHPVDIDVPRVVVAPPPTEDAFVASPEYRTAELSGRIAGPDPNGFRFDDGRSFYPARIVAGRIENATECATTCRR
jgi:hypothetical protein